MKYFTRLKIYKHRSVKFNPTTVEAFSYDWWRFVAKIKGKVVFNEYKYSQTTSRHQNQVRALLETLGITIDQVVNQRESL